MFLRFLFRAFEGQLLVAASFCAQQVAVCVAEFGIIKTPESIELFKAGASVFMSHNTRSQSFSIVLDSAPLLCLTCIQLTPPVLRD